MVDYWFHEGSRPQALYKAGRLARLEFDWGVRAVWLLPCDHCGADFEHSQPMTRYCSPECKKSGQRTKGAERVRQHRARAKAVLD